MSAQYPISSFSSRAWIMVPVGFDGLAMIKPSMAAAESWTARSTNSGVG